MSAHEADIHVDKYLWTGGSLDIEGKAQCARAILAASTTAEESKP